MPAGLTGDDELGSDLRRILVIQTAFIGDVILATALVEKLHAWAPSSQIDFLVRKGNERLLLHHPFLHEVLIWDKKKRWRSALSLLRKVRNRQYDLVVNAQRFATTGLLTAFSGARITSGFRKNPFSFMFTWKVPHVFDGIHEIERNQQLIAPLGPGPASKPRLYPSESDVALAREFETYPYITISPASVWFTKEFPVEQWIAFVGRVPHKLRIILLGSPADAVLCEGIATGAGRDGVVNLAGKLDLLPSAALMKNALMNYVNDSSPLHLASAVDAPVTAIYCSTVPRFGFTPLSSKAFIIETHENLDCRPCGFHGYKQCPKGHFKCAKTIALSDLVATLPD